MYCVGRSIHIDMNGFEGGGNIQETPNHQGFKQFGSSSAGSLCLFSFISIVELQFFFNVYGLYRFVCIMILLVLSFYTCSIEEKEMFGLRIFVFVFGILQKIKVTKLKICASQSLRC